MAMKIFFVAPQIEKYSTEVERETMEAERKAAEEGPASNSRTCAWKGGCIGHPTPCQVSRVS